MDHVVEPGSGRGRFALYAEAISALEGAAEAIAADNIQGRCVALQLATEAITTLYLNMDMKRSGGQVDDLADLYGYILGRLLRINLHNDARIAEQVIDLLEPLCDGADRPGILVEPPVAGDWRAPGFSADGRPVG